MIRSLFSLANHSLRKYPIQYQRLAYSFCTVQPPNQAADNVNEDVLKSIKQQKPRYSNNNQNKKHPNNKFSEDNLEWKKVTTEEYAKLLAQNINDNKLRTVTNRLEIERYRRIAVKEGYFYLNFVLAQCYVHNMRYFKDFITEYGFKKLLGTQYSDSQFDEFFYNFTLACVLIRDFDSQDVSKYYYGLFKRYEREHQQLVEKNATEKEFIQFKLTFALKFIPPTTDNREFKAYAETFLPDYFEKVLNFIEFNNKERYGIADVALAAQLYIFRDKQNVQEEGLRLFFSTIRKLDLENKEFSITKDQASSILQALNLAQQQNNAEFNKLIQNFVPLAMKIIQTLNGQIENLFQIVNLYYIMGNNETEVPSEQLIQTYKLLSKSLGKQKYEPVAARKSILYSLGKLSYKNNKITTYIQQCLEDVKTKQDKFHNPINISTLILASINLRILNKEGITKQLIDIILSSCKGHKKSLDSIALALYRVGYFEVEFWKPYFEQFQGKDSAFYADMIKNTYSLFKSDMSEEVANIFESKMSEYTVGPEKELQLQPPTKDQLTLQKYFQDNDLKYDPSVIVDGMFLSYQFQGTKDYVLIHHLNNFLIEENTTEHSYNVATQFKVECLKRKGLNVILLDSSKGDLVQQFTEKYQKSQ